MLGPYRIESPLLVEQRALANYKLFFRGSKCDAETLTCADSILDALECIDRAFSMVLVEQECLYASRDKIGRSGLLWKLDADVLCFSHLPMAEGWTDLSPEHIHKWTFQEGVWTHSVVPWKSPVVWQSQVPVPLTPTRVFETLRFAIQAQWDVKPDTVGVLFSGGVDSSLCAALLAEAGVPAISLYNVSFLGGRAPDRLTALVSYCVLCETFPCTKFRLVLIDVSDSERRKATDIVKRAILPERTVMDLNIGLALYFGGQRRGFELPGPETARKLLGVTKNDELEGKLEKMDLVLSKPKQASPVPCDLECANLDCRYRASSKCAHLKCKFCCRKDVSHGECRLHRPREIVLDLARPDARGHDEVLDEAWRALLAADTLKPYDGGGESLLVCGNGADELFGGYGRYRTAELHGDLSGWREEMLMDLKRLWKRNLGRDDRCMLAAQCSCVAHPYLHPAVVAMVAETSSKTLREGLTKHNSDSKMLIRETAQSLGLGPVVKFRKRAIQFGSRISHLVDSRSRRSLKGTHPL